MDLARVMDEIGTALGRVDGLRVFPYSADRVTPPAAMVLWPEQIDYDATMGRGADMITMPLILLVSRVDQRSGRDALAAYLDGSGPLSVKAAVEAHRYVSCDSVHVATAEVESITSAGTAYLGASLELKITGKGA